jgi:hypothetical protein
MHMAAQGRAKDGLIVGFTPVYSFSMREAFLPTAESGESATAFLRKGAVSLRLVSHSSTLCCGQKRGRM